jgi:transposase-like protein
MSMICVACPACGGHEVVTRIVSLVIARCTCRECQHSWTVAIERSRD